MLFDVTPRQLLGIAGEAPVRYRAALRASATAPGVFKLDYALSAPCPGPRGVPAGATVHLGGSFEQIAAAERIASRGGHPHVRSCWSPSRACRPDAGAAGHHTLWAYCHVPNGSDRRHDRAIEGQIERFAPGFGELVLARSARGPAEVEADNPNYIGGDINGGLGNLRQVLARPVLRRSPYTTPNPRIFLCSSSTPPGGGVHGMCGYHAARAVLSR